MHSDLRDRASLAVEIALEAGAQDAVANVSEHTDVEFAYRDGKLEKVQQSTTRGLSLRLFVDGRYSTHNTTDLRPEQVRGFIGDAVALTRHLQPDPHRVIPDPALYEGRADVDLEQSDATVRDLPRDVCLEWLGKMDEATHADVRVVSATSEVHYGWSASAQVSSNGFEGMRTGTGVGYGSGVTLDEGDGRRPEGRRFVYSRHLEMLPNAVAIAQEGLQRALDRLGSHKAPSARTTMVVHPEAGGGLLGYLSGALSAGAIQQNRSFLADKRDQKVASELFTMTDDPLLPRGLGSQLYDGEGIAARPMPIVEGGVLRNYYVDTYYGRKLGWQPTTGGSSNLVFAPGDRGLEDLVADAGAGFLVTGWLGGNADGTTGDFSFGFQGHRIENGRKGGPVSEMNITGNYLDLLGNLAAVGNDPNPWSSYRTPTLVFGDVEFSGE